MRAVAGDLAGGRVRGLVGIRADSCRETVFQRLLAAEDPAGVGQLAKDVVARQRPHEHRAGHVGHQTPADLHDRQLRLGMDVAHVGAEHDLETAAEGDAMDGGDHRHRHLVPDPCRVLRLVRDAVGALREPIERRIGLPGVTAVGQPVEVDAGAEGPTFAGQHHAADVRIARHRAAGFDERGEHRIVEGVHLVGTHHAHVGHAIGDVDADSIVH